MSDATIRWLCSDATYNIEAIYNVVRQKFKSHSTYQPAYLSRERVRLEIQRSLVRARCEPLFYSDYVRLLASRSLQVTTHSQKDWSVTNEIWYTGLRQDSYI